MGTSTEFLRSLQVISINIFPPDFPFNLSIPSTIEFYFSQCVTLFFLYRFRKSNKSTNTNTQVSSPFCKLFEMCLFISTNAASVFIILSDENVPPYFTIDLKYFLAIEIIIIYGLFVADIVTAKLQQQEQTREEGDPSRVTSKDASWLKYLSNLNNDFLKIIISYNLIIINYFPMNTIFKLVEFGIKIYCIFIMLRYEFESEDEDEGEEECDVCQKV